MTNNNHQDFFSPSNWLRGFFLNERFEMYRRSGRNTSSHPTQEAYERFQAWKESIKVTEDEFLEILSLKGIDKNDLLHVLSGHFELTAATYDGYIDWIDDLKAIHAGKFKDIVLPTLKFALPDSPDNVNELPFKPFLEPFLKYSADKLRVTITEIEAIGNAQFHIQPEVAQKLLHQLATVLLTYSSRTLVLELQIARLRQELVGATPDERYRYFCENILSRPDVFLKLTHEYAVLTRLLLLTIENWNKSIREMLIRLSKDYKMICHSFLNGKPSGNLAAVSSGLSDSHREGRTVFHLEFSSGLRVIYKPKPLQMDRQFQKLLSFLNEHGLQPEFYTLKTIDAGEYGWVEFIEHEGCHSEEEIKRFYRRQGGYLALLYLLEATDFHSENLIAKGENPVLIDLEALFHHYPSIEYPETAYGLASKELDNSVLRTGLLPVWLWATHDQSGVDISGIGGEVGQVTPRPIPILDQIYTDEMRVVRRQYLMKDGEHRPLLDGMQVDTRRYVEEVILGFEEVYHLLEQHRETLLTNDELVHGFDNVVGRQILRGTRSYALFIQEGQHPDYLRDGIDRDILLDRLWIGVRRQGFMKAIIPSEQKALLYGDIPLFETRPNQRHVWDNYGNCFENFFSNSSMDLVIRRLKNLSPKDRGQQLIYLKGTLASIDRSHDFTPPTLVQSTPQPLDMHLEHNDFLLAATQIAEQLMSSAFETERDAGWIGLTLDNNNRWILTPIGTDLYNGCAGIALFLGYLSRFTNRSDVEILARKALQPVRDMLKIHDSLLKLGTGAFSGWASMLYVMSHLSIIWDEPGLLDEALSSLSFLEDEISSDPCMDILSGLAGCAIVLVNLYHLTGEAKCYELALRCGNRLCENAKPFGQGVGWFLPNISSEPLAGFAHGVAGIAWALLIIAEMSGDERYRQIALSSINYERGLFVLDQGNWLDLRNLVTTSPFHNHIPTRWCHGAPGVLLGRSLILPYLDDGLVLSEITTGIDTTLANGFGGSHCLCHGDLGNADILFTVGERLGRADLCEHAHRIAGSVLQSGLNGNGWKCGLPQSATTPSFMVGLAGIGYGLLRFWSPAQVPSVLQLALPILPHKTLASHKTYNG